MRLRRLVRSPFLFWTAATALAVVTASTLSGAAGAARHARQQWGTSVAVVVATRDVAVGQRIVVADVATRVQPLASLPAGALRATASAVGRVAVVALFRGEVVGRGHVGAAGARGAPALVPVGRRGVAVPTGASSAPVERGDLVDVLALSATGTGDAAVIASGALVVDVGENAVTVAVSPAEAARVAGAVARGAVALAIRSPEEPSG